VVPFGFQFNCKPTNGCFSSEPRQICKIQTCQEAKLNKTRLGFTRGAAVKKRAINNASQNLKPAGLVWKARRSLRMLQIEGLQLYPAQLSPETRDLQGTDVS